MKALVTGAGGFIGSHLCRRLVSQGVAVRAMLSPRGGRDRLANLAHLEFVTADITDPATLAPALDGISHVYHLAGLPRDWGPGRVFEKINNYGTKNVLDAAIGAGAKRFVQVSTVAGEAYLNAYARSKLRAEEQVKSRSSEIETVIIRPALYPYGPGDREATTQMFEAISKGRFGFIGAGKSRFGLIYVEDLAHAIALAGSAPAAAGRSFDLSDGRPQTWEHWAADVARALGAPRPKLSLPRWLAWGVALALEGSWKTLGLRTPPPLTRYRVHVASRELLFPDPHASAALGFVPETPWPVGLHKTVEWYRHERET